MWSFLNVCFPIAMIFGQFLAAVMCKKIGRKGTALVACAVYIPATLLSAGAKLFHSFELLYVGRILWSLANGVNSVNATVWIVECAPPNVRGRMAAMQEFFMAAGSLVTQALGVPFSDDALWPWIFLPNIAFVVVSLIMFLFLYESPQYIMQKGDTEKIAYVFTGARCLRAYSTFVLHSMGGWSHSAALMESLILGIVRLPTTLIPILLVDRIGRRPMLIGSTGICFVSLLLLLVAIDIGPSWKIATLIGLATLLLISACGIGSLSRFYSAELVPRSILLSSVSILTMFEALTKIGVEFAFYPLANVIHGQSMFLFLAPTGVFTIMMWMCPETSRRSVNEVLNDMAQRKKLDVVFPT
ncbi:transporter, major facilitator family protein [Necator americanus]|uniref:Transporter, major facilitator family protein n=1 Tax=Necator americanus TaxID=51031 RepID=W2T4E8_NECAM|nr:transporter, major facilitator family protein [Necator americanus]ETN76116.1 transporter, major facilitator family protein [Necator americanus]